VVVDGRQGTVGVEIAVGLPMHQVATPEGDPEGTQPRPAPKRRSDRRVHQDSIGPSARTLEEERQDERDRRGGGIGMDPGGRPAFGATVEYKDAGVGLEGLLLAERDFGGDLAVADERAAATGKRLTLGRVSQTRSRTSGEAHGIEASASAEGEVDLSQARGWSIPCPGSAFERQ